MTKRLLFIRVGVLDFLNFSPLMCQLFSDTFVEMNDVSVLALRHAPALYLSRFRWFFPLLFSLWGDGKEVRKKHVGLGALFPQMTCDKANLKMEHRNLAAPESRNLPGSHNSLRCRRA